MDTTKKIATRNGFGEEIVNLGKNNDKIYVMISANLAKQALL